MNVSRRRVVYHRFPPNVLQREPLNVEVGCGKSKERLGKGYVGVDIIDFGQEVVWDVEKGLPFPDKTVDHLYCAQTLEHLDSPLDVLNEFHRVLKPGKVAEIVVPRWDHEGALELTHTRTFNEESFKYLRRTDRGRDFYGFLPWDIQSTKVDKFRNLYVKMVPLQT